MSKIITATALCCCYVSSVKWKTCSNAADVQWKRDRDGETSQRTPRGHLCKRNGIITVIYIAIMCITWEPKLSYCCTVGGLIMLLWQNIIFLPSIYQNAELEPILYECSKCCHHIENEDAAALLQNCRIFYWAHLAILQFSLSSPSVTVVELKANKFEVAAYFALKTLQILSSISSEVAHPSWINLFTPS